MKKQIEQKDIEFICKKCKVSLDIEDIVCPYCNTKREGALDENY